MCWIICLSVTLSATLSACLHAWCTFSVVHVLSTYGSPLCNVANGHISRHVLTLQQSLQDVCPLVLSGGLRAETAKSEAMQEMRQQQQ